MCTPPFCEPARRCLGCISLRKASGMIIALNALYGFMLVVVHVFIFRERSTIMSAMETAPGRLLQAATPPPVVPIASDGGGITSRHKDNWYLQVMDLDLAWAHGVLGLGDWYLCMLGLIYGLVIIAFSIFVLQVVVTNGPQVKSLSKWFMIFLHVELFLYIALVTVKLPLLCKIKQHFLTLMNEDCDVLRFMFFERAVTRIIIGSLCCWVFSSFSYFLAWGDAGVDDPTLGDETQGQRFQQYHGSQQHSPAHGWPSVMPQDAYAHQPPTRSSVYRPSDGMQPHRGSFAASAVGEPVSVSSKYEPRWVSGAGAGSRPSFAINSSVVAPDRGSFSAGGGHYASQQYIMPRQSSSMQSNTTNVSHHSQHTAERQMLIKPPIVIH